MYFKKCMAQTFNTSLVQKMLGCFVRLASTDYEQELRVPRTYAAAFRS